MVQVGGTDNQAARVINRTGPIVTCGCNQWAATSGKTPGPAATMPLPHKFTVLECSCTTAHSVQTDTQRKRST